MSKESPTEGNQRVLTVKDRRCLKPLAISGRKQNQTLVINPVKKSKIFGKEAYFYQPNNIALCMNISENAIKKAHAIRRNHFVGKKYVDGKKNISENKLAHLYDYFENVQVALIFSYTAVESFSNLAIPHDFLFEKTNQRGVKEMWNKENIERWMSTSEKLNGVLPKIFSKESPAKQKFWSNFIRLEESRNEIIHQKTVRKETGVSDKMLDRLLDPEAFDWIVCCREVIEYFCDKDSTHPYVPLGIGSSRVCQSEVDDLDKTFEVIERENKE